MFIQTVNGLKKIKKMGIVDAHVHLWAKNEDSSNKIPEVCNVKLVKQCIDNFISNGGSLLVDCSPYECGRNGNVLYELSKKTGVDIVCVTGFHLQKYYPKDSKIWNCSLEQAKTFFKKEIELGLFETRDSERTIKAGIIKIAFAGSLENKYKTLTDAAIETSLETGVPILVHTERGFNVEWLADYIESVGLSPNKVVFCHVDKRNDIGIHRDLANRGFYLEYDTFLRHKYNPSKNVYVLMVNMLKERYQNRLMVGTDISENAMWEQVNSNIGYGSFFEQLKNYLSKKFETSDVLNILGKNAYHFLEKN
jgi:5-phospho-D-xylono-1,4-lactonase